MHTYPADATLYFLADSHLSDTQPEINAAFIDALSALKDSPPDALYILGDLFDYWLGDDLANPYQQEIAAKIAELAAYCPIYYQHGNRDFLLGEAFAACCSMSLLPEREVIEAGKERILIEHGDLLCLDDVGYQRLRRVLRSKITQGLYRLLPKRAKQSIGARLRQESRERGALKPEQITDVQSQAVHDTMRDYGVTTLIHGHTHRCASHKEEKGMRYVLGDWHPCGMMLRYANNHMSFVSSNQLRNC
ncbi:UDP-2,3-diacylglucosamine diphosphatase [Suttonella sp. R2A3]|uniref:UDP-2,3-diacylglucosamine diphosphatase n=1 Tax=Suttonella sp. R2A3 TaxID=2908648 RepID=UPI001F2C2B1F|nr:UDP-2,3-diacylglucosamine diphosphatase [Suttonella sp. R2A3]UJF24000.1 UDP-2,3-diacylglucosamine diphosphatase [Suttonella sp. R2A3]